MSALLLSRRSRSSIAFGLLAAFIFSFASFSCCENASAATRGGRRRQEAKQMKATERTETQSADDEAYEQPNIAPGRTTLPTPTPRYYPSHRYPHAIYPPYGPIYPPYGPIHPIYPPYGPIHPIYPPYGPIIIGSSGPDSIDE